MDWKRTYSRDQSAIDAHTERGMPFDLIRVTRYALKITDMRYLCGTVVIIPDNFFSFFFIFFYENKFVQCTGHTGK